MIRHPYGHDELDRDDPALDAVGEQLQDFAADERSEPPIDLAPRIHAAIDDEPDPAVGWRARFAGGGAARWRNPARGLAAAAVVAAAVVAALVIGDLADLISNPNGLGTTPSPPSIVSPSPLPTPTPTPSLSPSLSPSPTVSPTPSPPPATPVPSASDDPGEFETPEPSESDNSGPGSGDGDGGGDNSGPGGGSGSGSGSGD